jgi:polyphosphate kinase
MQRNFFRRVEIAFPVVEPALAKQVVEALDTMWRDTVRARELRPDGTYVRLAPKEGETPVDSQTLFVEDARRRVLRAVEAFQRRGAEAFEAAERTAGPEPVESAG